MVFQNPQLVLRTWGSQILFSALWCLADREGRLEDRPLRIRAEVFPYLCEVQVDALLHALARKNFIKRYKTAQGRFIQILNFAAHQNPHPRETASQIPPPKGLQKKTIRGAKPEEGAPKANPGRALGEPRCADPVPVPVPVSVPVFEPDLEENTIQSAAAAASLDPIPLPDTREYHAPHPTPDVVLPTPAAAAAPVVSAAQEQSKVAPVTTTPEATRAVVPPIPALSIPEQPAQIAPATGPEKALAASQTPRNRQEELTALHQQQKAATAKLDALAGQSERRRAIVAECTKRGLAGGLVWCYFAKQPDLTFFDAVLAWHARNRHLFSSPEGALRKALEQPDYWGWYTDDQGRWVEPPVRKAKNMPFQFTDDFESLKKG